MITCAVCEQKIRNPLIKWKDFPLTDVYVKEKGYRFVIDQEFYLCDECGHGQLGNQIDQKILYGSDYSFRTSKGRSKQENQIVKDSIPNIHFDNIIEIGCNDLYLLKQLRSKANTLIGIDPILEDASDGNLIAIKEFAEDVDFSKFRGKSLILSSHFLEHIGNPRNLLETLFQNTNDESLFHFAFPCFDYLLNDGRFDQVYNHHLQYFSQYSFDYLLKEIGFNKMEQDFIPAYWGTMITTFNKFENSNRFGFASCPTKDRVRFSYDWFKRTMQTTISKMKTLSEPLYGYGASLQIPVLNYHLDNELLKMKYLIDDDENKKDLYPLNLDVQIKHSSECDLKNRNVIITALNFGNEILSQLQKNRPKNIIHPLQ